LSFNGLHSVITTAVRTSNLTFCDELWVSTGEVSAQGHIAQAVRTETGDATWGGSFVKIKQVREVTANCTVSPPRGCACSWAKPKLVPTVYTAPLSGSLTRATNIIKHDSQPCKAFQKLLHTLVSLMSSNWDVT
jgi:hypothetical protein